MLKKTHGGGCEATRMGGRYSDLRYAFSGFFPAAGVAMATSISLVGLSVAKCGEVAAVRYRPTWHEAHSCPRATPTVDAARRCSWREKREAEATAAAVVLAAPLRHHRLLRHRCSKEQRRRRYFSPPTARSTCDRHRRDGGATVRATAYELVTATLSTMVQPWRREEAWGRGRGVGSSSPARGPARRRRGRERECGRRDRVRERDENGEI